MDWLLLDKIDFCIFDTELLTQNKSAAKAMKNYKLQFLVGHVCVPSRIVCFFMRVPTMILCIRVCSHYDSMYLCVFYIMQCVSISDSMYLCVLYIMQFVSMCDSMYLCMMCVIWIVI